MNPYEANRVLDRGLGAAVKRALQAGIRGVHRTCLSPGLPRHLGFFFHEFPVAEYDGLRRLAGTLGSRGYRFTDAASYAGSRESGALTVQLSFDDNYSTWHAGLDVLRQLEIPALFYVNTLILDRAPDDPVTVDFYRRLGQERDLAPLSRAQLREIAAAGHAIGAHTHSHFNLGALAPQEALEEIRKNLEILEDLLQTTIEDFSFPFGMPRHFPAHLRPELEKLGIRRIAHATPCMLHAPVDGATIHRNFIGDGRGTEEHLRDASIDGHWFVRLTGRSPA